VTFIPGNNPLSTDYVIVFDGGSLGNPGVGYGSYALLTRDGHKAIQRLSLGEYVTNNEAEYDTLIAALRDLIGQIEASGRAPSAYTLEVRGDSALVLKQVGGEWKARDARMRARRDQVCALLNRFKSVRLTLQPRTQTLRMLGH
jgi:ribonuclease HI